MYIVEFIKLRKQARKRRSQAFRPGTNANHITMFSKYIKFCLKYNLQYIDPSVETISVYIEFLAQNFRSHRSVANYIGAIRLLHKFLDVKPCNLQSFHVSLMLRATTITMRQIPNRKPPVTTQMMIRICELCDNQGVIGHIIKLALLLGFLGFLRASNLCPATVKSFDTTRHLTRADLTFTPPGLIL